MPFHRGDYRIFKKDDFKSLVYKTFNLCIIKHYPLAKIGLTVWIKKNFWSKISKNYNRLKYPKDIGQRQLTSYSYLRCIPYKFLNNFHQRKVDKILNTLEKEEKEIITFYYLEFRKDKAIKEKRGISDPLKIRTRTLSKISKKDYLVFALLEQIERY